MKMHTSVWPGPKRWLSIPHALQQAMKPRTTPGVGCIVGGSNNRKQREIGPPEQAVTLRAMTSCADENAHVSVAGAETMTFHPSCAAASTEGEDHSRWWKHCWMPQQQENWEIGPPEQAVTHRAMISCADENAHCTHQCGRGRNDGFPSPMHCTKH